MSSLLLITCFPWRCLLFSQARLRLFTAASLIALRAGSRVIASRSCCRALIEAYVTIFDGAMRSDLY